MAEPSITVNLPVADLSRARAFRGALGFDDRVSDDGADCVAVSPTIRVMLVRRDGAPQAPIDLAPADPALPLLSLSRPSRDTVDALVAAGLAAGGADARQPRGRGHRLHGRALRNPDAHLLEAVWMNLARAAPTLRREIDAAVDA
jgi:hypothetical protein